ncbi:MAG: serine/threonine protein kinase [Goleter apudmare HA4340-LM2]|jgi:serine/threonine-protein kinase|nr:serine/threonine protein kinase [Goleter apudmare HA4340-LM2]
MLGNLLDGRYQVLRVLGGGGFGQTYVAQDTHRPGYPKCVVKHLKPVTHDPEFLKTARRLFTSEAETLEQLGNHEQIPRLLAYFEENQEFFLVQDFIEGHPLKAELLPGQRWTEEQVIQLLYQLLVVLEFVHSKKVIHRDIKPENIIRNQKDGKLVLIDFGAVKHIQSQLLMTQTHTDTTIAIGTPGYMSTEQGRGKPRPNSDIYSLGIIGIQALTGLHPRQLEEDHDTGEIYWQHQATVSPGLAEVLSKMVLHHFKERYQSATDVLQAIQQLSTEIGEQSTQVSQVLILQQQAVVQPFSTNISRISVEQYNHLENILLELVGPVAPTLLRQLVISAPSYEELVDSLQIHLTGQTQIEFKRKAMLPSKESSTKNQPKTQNISITPPIPQPQTNISDDAVSESFVRQCEGELISLIGPIATFLVQKAVKSSPGISRSDLVRILAAEIADPQKALQFQQRLLA